MQKPKCKEGSHWAKANVYLVSELGSEPRSVWFQSFITLHRINTGSILESPACPSRPVVSVNLENVGDRWQYCWTKECLSSPALLTYGYF